MVPTITKECSQFLHDSKGIPLIKNLPKFKDGFRKVKVRKKKINNQFVETFNQSFPIYKDLLNRSIIINPLTEHNINMEQFYIFPLNGYKVLYNPMVKKASTDVQRTFDLLTSNMKDGAELFIMQIKTTYINGNVYNAINENCEIIIYGIPYFYAIRKTLIDDYKKFVYN